MAAKTPAQRRQQVVAQAKFQLAGMSGNLGSLLHAVKQVQQQCPDEFPGVDMQLLRLKSITEDLFFATREATEQIDQISKRLQALNAAKKKISVTSQTKAEGG